MLDLTSKFMHVTLGAGSFSIRRGYWFAVVLCFCGLGGWVEETCCDLSRLCLDSLGGKSAVSLANWHQSILSPKHPKPSYFAAPEFPCKAEPWGGNLAGGRAVFLRAEVRIRQQVWCALGMHWHALNSLNSQYTTLTPNNLPA